MNRKFDGTVSSRAAATIVEKSTEDNTYYLYLCTSGVNQHDLLKEHSMTQNPTELSHKRDPLVQKSLSTRWVELSMWSWLRKCFTTICYSWN